VKKQQLHKALSSGVHISMLQLCEGEKDLLLNSLTTHAPASAMPTSIAELLCSFDDIFQEPANLPPVRPAHDHKIPLVSGVVPVNKRPYRYAKHQKDIIDGLVKEFLHLGIIQNSSNPYSSPVVLVGELNKATMKNRFSIPLVDDLLDELHGSKWFSNVDLRSGYNQVRMDENDVHKIAFKTYVGHFEYLVMPFGLTNAPATFQGLMNVVFQEYLRKFLLVFFYDTLIYSKSLEDHVSHLHIVFSTIRSNSLFAKRS